MVNNIAKQLTSQKFIFKIHSDRLRKSNWNLKLSISEACKNEEVIKLSDSSVLRFINEINDINSQEVDIKVKQLRNELKKILKCSNSNENRKKIKEIYSKLNDLQFVSDYVSVIMDKEKDFLRAVNGFSINGIKYKRLVGTTNGVKKETIVFVSQKSNRNNNPIYRELKKRLCNGRDETVKFVPAKYEAYQSLACSSSIPVSNPKGILVVDDCETSFLSNYIKLDDSNSSEPIMTTENQVVSLIDSDGYGLMLPSLSKRWSEELRENYLISGCCIRNSFCKGMVFTFDFVDFANKIAKNTKVIDVWGKEWDINDIELILPVSMLKLWNCYDSIEHYLKCCEENKYTFGITKICPEKLENSRDLNYQFIQSYDLTDEEIKELTNPTIREIKDCLGNDVNKTILFLKGMFVNEFNVDKIDCDFIKALMIDPYMINDPFVLSKIHSMIKKRINQAKIGVLKVSGNFSIVSGDPFSFCQHIFGLKVTGLLESGQAYSKYWNEKSVDKVVCFRAPMTCHNNIRILNITNSDEISYWYKYMETVTIFNSWDMSAHALNGLDKDGDLVFTTDNHVLLSKTKELPAIQCIQRNAEKKIITETNLIQANIDSFGDEIGTTTNHITNMFEVMSRYENDSLEYKTLEYRVKCGQLFQQNAIDKTKGIVAKPMPKEWYDKNANKIKPSDTDEDKLRKEFNLRILADKKPYFFNYIYPQQKTMYDKYIKNSNRKAMIEFKLNIEELRKKEDKSEKEIKFLEFYDKQMPVGLGACVMNKICWNIEDEFNGYVSKLKNQHKDFDYSILKSNVEYSKQSFKNIQKIYQTYLDKVQEFMRLSKKERYDQQDVTAQKSVFKTYFKQECQQVCPNSQELCDIILDLCYTNNNSKQFAWDVCGDIFIENLLKRNNYTIKYLSQDENGDVEFCGEMFSVGFKKIGCEEI